MFRYLFHDGGDLSFGKEQFAFLDQFDGIFQGSHVHVFDYLFDQPVFEKTCVELNDVGTVAPT